jgi:hypothetical protein
VSKHAVRLLDYTALASVSGDRCRRLLSPERSSLDAARRQTYARAQKQGWRLGSCFCEKEDERRLLLEPCFARSARLISDTVDRAQSALCLAQVAEREHCAARLTIVTW